ASPLLRRRPDAAAVTDIRRDRWCAGCAEYGDASVARVGGTLPDAGARGAWDRPCVWRQRPALVQPDLLRPELLPPGSPPLPARRCHRVQRGVLSCRAEPRAALARSHGCRVGV